MIDFPQDEKSFERCPNCGRLREKDTGSCVFCGHVFEDEKSEYRESTKDGIKIPVPKLGGGNPIGDLLVIPILLVIFGAFVMSIGLVMFSSLSMMCCGMFIISGAFLIPFLHLIDMF